MFAKFDEIPTMILQAIKETKHYGHTVGLCSIGRTDNMETVYPPTNTVCVGYNECSQTYTLIFQMLKCRLLRSQWSDLVDLN